MFNLFRVNHNNPDLSQLDFMRRSIEDFLYSSFEVDSKQWNEQLQSIVSFQAEDGSFMLVNSPRIPPDAFFDFCNFPTVLCNSIIMKAVLIDPGKYEKYLPALKKGLEASAAMGFEGHGYDAIDGMYDCIVAYSNAGLRFFMDNYSEISPAFVERVDMALDFAAGCIRDGRFVHGFNNDYEEIIRNMHRALTHRSVFTYGTLMTGEYNHGYVDELDFAGEGIIHGYELFNLGRYPGIKHSDYKITVFGEVYVVDDNTLASMNRLEGEGSLYMLKCADTVIGDYSVVTGVYVYNDTHNDCTDENRIFTGSWKQQKIYIAYGSNMNDHQMLSVRCPSSKCLGTSKLDGYRLLFRANKAGNIYATVEEDAASSVPVVLWAIDQKSEDELDRCEGYHSYDPLSSYYLKKTIPVNYNGESVSGIVYVMINYGKTGKPSDEYFNRILTGYKEHGIDSAPLMSALER